MGLAVLEYFLLPRETLVFGLEPPAERPWLIKLPVGREHVRRLVEELRNSITPGAPAPSTAGEVYSILMDQALGKLPEDVSQLVIIPHDELHHVPFAALWSGTEYLGERLTVSQLPSMQALQYVRERARRITSPCLAVGADPGGPVFRQQSFEGEAVDVASRFGVEPILGADARRDRIIPRLSHTGVLHFSLHGRFVPRNALHSGLQLSPTSSEDGARRSRAPDVLMARDFLRCGLDAELVVLSACQTGLQAIHPGDELEGLTQALLYAGAASVIVSLWPVDTVATREFMRAFYASWQTDGNSRAGALRQAGEQIRRRSLARILELAARELIDSTDENRLRIHVEMGDLCSGSGWLPEAEDHYARALALATALRLPLDTSLIQESLGEILIGMGRGGEGRLLLEEASRAGEGLPLRAARRRFRSEDRAPQERREAHAIHPWSSPFFWAPFVLVGEWR